MQIETERSLELGTFVAPERVFVNIKPIDGLRMEPGSGHPPYVPSASGLVHHRGKLFVISDEENALAVFDPYPGKGRWLTVLAGELPAEKKARKAVKSDWEAIARVPAGLAGAGEALLLVPSGSKPQRMTGALVALDESGKPHGIPRTVDFSTIYGTLGIDELNVEGVALFDNEVLLFHRGNGGAGGCRVVRARTKDFFASLLEGKPFAKSSLIKSSTVSAGDIDGAPLTFTDACALVDGSVLCTFAAEGGGSTYEDGEVAGSGVGLLAPDGTLRVLTKIGGSLKLEGITVTKDEGGVLEGLLVSDPDDREEPSGFFSFRFER